MQETTLRKYEIDPDNENTVLLDILKEECNIMETQKSLFISVLGEAKNFKLGGRRKENLNNALIQAATSTDVWFITSRTNMECMKVVADAVKNYRYIESKGKDLSRGFHCIGIVPKYCKKGEETENQSNNQAKTAESENNTDSTEYHLRPVNQDHTHVLLVDKDKDLERNYPNTNKVRVEVHSLLGNKTYKVPLVLLVVEGGIECIKEVHELCVKKQIPVVVVEGTGRAADILAYAFKETSTTRRLNDRHMDKIEGMLKGVYSDIQYTELNEIKRKIQEWSWKNKLITVVNIDDQREKLDVAILEALLKGGHSTSYDKLRLAIAWDRIVIAEKMFLEKNSCPENVDTLFTEALLNNRVEFLKLFLQNSVLLQNYLTVERLRDIYNRSAEQDNYNHPWTTYNSSNGEKNEIRLWNVHEQLKVLMRNHEGAEYADTNSPDQPSQSNAFQEPATELLLWAILNKKKVVAEFFWERSMQPIRDAIVAVCLFEALFNTVPHHETILRNTYKQWKTDFENVAVDAMKVCESVDKGKAVEVIDRKNTRWGNVSLIKMAEQAKALRFTGSPSTMTAVELTWKRGMKDLTEVKLFLAFFFPLVLFTNMYGFLPLEDGKKRSCWDKLKTFYNAPVTKFFGNCISYLIFLILYSYTALFNFRYHMTVTEKIVFFWICVLILGEVGELLVQPPKTFRGKFDEYISTFWNKFDVASLSLALVAQVLRIFQRTFSAGRIMFAINTTVFFTRMFRMYQAHYKLGPKVITLYRMIFELGFFVLLLLVCILGYGIACHALLHPYQSPSFQSVVQIMSFPYWQMYGDLSFDQLKGDNATCTQTTEYCEYPEEYEWVVMTMLAVFMLVGNVLLLNLLITGFTYVFDEVHENSMDIWKYGMLQIAREYDSRPSIPVYGDVVIIYKYLFNKSFGEESQQQNEILNDLTQFEKECSKRYLRKKKEETASSSEERVKRMEKTLEELVQLKKH